MADLDTIEQLEAHVAQLQNALDHVQRVLHDVDGVHKAAKRTASVLRVVVVAATIGLAAYGIAVAVRNANQPR
jgi:hypothetical protein